jgi:WD40 repeat protein
MNGHLNTSSKIIPKKLSGHKSLIHDVAISQTGLLIASASSDCTVRIWSNSDEENSLISSQVYKHNSLPVKSVDISCDSKLIVTGSDDKTVKIIKISDKKVLATLPAHSNWVKCVRFSRDSRLIVSASDDKSVKLWDVNSLAQNSTLENVHKGVVNVVRFHPDNYSLATGCFDKKIRIFDVRSKKLVQVYEEHTKPVTSLDFDPSGNYLASTSFDETVKIYDLRYGNVLYTLTGHEAATSAVAFSKFGDVLATGGADSIINLWTTNLDEEDDKKHVKYACNEFPFELDVNSIPQSAGTLDYGSEKSSPKMINAEINYTNRNRSTQINFDENYLPEKQIYINNSFSYENISEELSKVFERMVYQLELITT